MSPTCVSWSCYEGDLLARSGVCYTVGREDNQRLTIKVRPTSRPLRIAVLFVPGQTEAGDPPALVPLQQWSGRR
jgi:hypothetical protein